MYVRTRGSPSECFERLLCASKTSKATFPLVFKTFRPQFAFWQDAIVELSCLRYVGGGSFMNCARKRR
jgi:hypothetical protein